MTNTRRGTAEYGEAKNNKKKKNNLRITPSSKYNVPTKFLY